MTSVFRASGVRHLDVKQKPGQAPGFFTPATQAKGGGTHEEYICVQEAGAGQASLNAQMVRLREEARPEGATPTDRYPKTPLATRSSDQRKSGPAAGREPAVIESGDTQPQRRLTSAGGWNSLGLGRFRFLFYCSQMGACLVFARLLSITFQHLALR
jgi:hypothetical protein